MAKRRADFLVLAIDIGTSSTRAALFDNSGRPFPETPASKPYQLTYGSDGKAELNPLELLRAVTRTSDQVLQAYRSRPRSQRLPIRAIGASALWHGLLGLD